MKKSDALFIVLIAAYSYLFYAQSAGINFLLFTILVTSSIALQKPFLMKSPAWLVAAIGSILASVCVFLYGNTLSVFANILSMLLAAGFSANRKASVIFSLLHALYSYVMSLPEMFIQFAERLEKHPDNPSGDWIKKVLVVVLPVLVTFCFVLLYRSANPLFDELVAKIDLSFISWGMLFFTLTGMPLVYGTFAQKHIPWLKEIDQAASDKLQENSSDSGFLSSIVNEFQSGVILLYLLNGLLLVVNVVDFQFLLSLNKLPHGITYSTFLHQSINTLIFSIIVAIAVILFYFRGNLNFHKNRKHLKVLAFAWIVQNGILIITSAAKNNLYIMEYALTYKRIGVYVYLLLCLIGLIITYLKNKNTHSNWFLFRKSSWAFYVVLIGSCFFPWDQIIVSHNLSKPAPDERYLLSLSASVIPEMLRYQQNYGSDPTVSMLLSEKAISYAYKQNDKGWQSLNLDDVRVQQAIKENWQFIKAHQNLK
ncbi:DUF4173 domain-containing protein [Cytophagaceae bacterium ABcell3]|nr:DUF4173 domain-containing protein [Cytophagaceae bacterium ABcell3]